MKKIISKLGMILSLFILISSFVIATPVYTSVGHSLTSNTDGNIFVTYNETVNSTLYISKKSDFSTLFINTSLQNSNSFRWSITSFTPETIYYYQINGSNANGINATEIRSFQMSNYIISLELKILFKSILIGACLLSFLTGLYSKDNATATISIFLAFGIAILFITLF